MAEQPLSFERLSSRQKAALLILSLDVTTATRVMKEFSQQDIEELSVEITNLKGVPSGLIDKVMNEFHQLITAQEYVISGGLEHAQRLLEESFGISKSNEIIEKIKVLTHVKGFGILRSADGQQLASFLQKEHPQTITLILSNLSPEQTSQVLVEFPDDLRNDVIYRMATLGKVSPSLIAEMEDVVESIAETEISQSMSSMGGTKAVATILNKFTNANAKVILDTIDKRESQLAAEIKRLMFLFEDLVYLDDRSVQRLLREVDKKDLALSLKIAEEELKKKIMSNMSERAQEMLREEIQYLGPVRLKDVEAAQTRIVDIVKQLEDSGELVVAGRGGIEDVLV